MKKAYIGIDSHKEQNVVAVAMAGRGEPELYWKARRASRRSRPAPARRICSRDPAPRRRRKRVPCSNGAAQWRPARPPSGGSCSELETGGVAVESPLQNLKRNHRFMETTLFSARFLGAGRGSEIRSRTETRRARRIIGKNRIRCVACRTTPDKRGDYQFMKLTPFDQLHTKPASKR